MIKIGQSDGTPVSERSDLVFSRESKQPVSTVVPRQGISLDDKIAARKARDPNFKNRMREAAKGLLPLAETDDGSVTMTSLRLAAALTQAELAHMTNSRQPNISAMEAGQRDNPSRETMRLLCAALACDMNTLDQAIHNSKLMYEQYVRKQEERHV